MARPKTVPAPKLQSERARDEHAEASHGDYRQGGAGRAIRRTGEQLARWTAGRREHDWMTRAPRLLADARLARRARRDCPTATRARSIPHDGREPQPLRDEPEDGRAA